MLKNKLAIVTGSTSGIGLGIAQALAKEGANIIINGFGDKDAIEKERAGIEKNYSVKCRYLGADISKPAEVEKMIKDAGDIDILVNNAGIQFVAPIEDFPLEKWDAVIATNLSASFYTMKYALAGMKKRKSGRIINIASAHGLVASTGKAAYVAAKHGLVGLTKVVALEAANNGNITCNAICPGWVYTPLVEKQINDNAKKEGISPDKAKEEMLKEKQANFEFATPEEIAGLVVYLCSDLAKSITGAALSIDNGWTCQ